jgi:hypothetical protein
VERQHHRSRSPAGPFPIRGATSWHGAPSGISRSSTR